MTTTKLEKNVWKSYFDRLSKHMEGMDVQIDVASLQFGSQPVARWQPLFGVIYDTKDDVIAVMAEGLDHMIRQPQAVFVEARGPAVHSMAVMTADGTRQIITFKQPLLLPAQ